MKVAMISFYCMDSTIPLAKHLSLTGTKVDLYCILPYGNQNTFVFNFSDNKQPPGFVDPEIARATMGAKLSQYLATVNVKTYIYPNGRIQNIFLQDLYAAYKLSLQLKKGKYDLVHIIHTANRFWNFLYFFLDKKKIVQTLHEVTTHESTTPFLKKIILKRLIKNSTPIIFNSNISKTRFIEFRNKIKTTKNNKENLTMIRFGLYETHYCFSAQTEKNTQNGKITILNFGRIVPYKGIHLLIDAIKLLQDQYPIHLIVAGEGKPYFDFNRINSYEFINRPFTNEEVVHMIENCDMVVLPYTSASQSGIPMTVYSFNKPVIASNIAGFREVIDHLKTGILVDNLKASSLAEAIEILLKSPDLKREMSENIKRKYQEGEFSWRSIADKTLSFYHAQIDNS